MPAPIHPIHLPAHPIHLFITRSGAHRRARSAGGRGIESGDRARARGKARSVELLKICQERLPAYKVPKSVDFVESLPHTQVGKVNKIRVREMFLRL